MKSENVLDRLDNPPIIDGRDKPIDLGDMPEDMDLELAKAAIYDIIEEVCEKYKEGDLRSKTFRHNLGIAIFRMIKNEGFVYKVIDKEPKKEKIKCPKCESVYSVHTISDLSDGNWHEIKDGSTTIIPDPFTVSIKDINKEIAKEMKEEKNE